VVAAARRGGARLMPAFTFKPPSDETPQAAPASRPLLGRVIKAVVILLAGGLLARGLFSGMHTRGAPDFTLKDLDAADVTLSSFRGKNIVILDFWATWCPPCRMTMPVLQRLKDRFGDKGLVILSINLQEEAGPVRDFVTAEGYTMHILLDSNGAVSNSYGVKGIPTLVVLDKSGGVRLRESGFSGETEEKLGKLVEGLL
jgi:thiol-disulfide isomerase/thioredoxin